MSPTKNGDPGKQLLTEANIVRGDAFIEIANIKVRCVIITSPPYPDRNMPYPCPSEADYPAWTVRWMRQTIPILEVDGSVILILSPGMREGRITSGWIRRTLDAIEQDGWLLLDEFHYEKIGAKSRGNIKHPRRTGESIYWLARTTDAYIDLHAYGLYSDRIEPTGHGHEAADGSEYRSGIARIPESFKACVSKMGSEREFVKPRN